MICGFESYRAYHINKRFSYILLICYNVSMDTLICKKCEKHKVLSSFKKDRYCTRGYRNICKQCIARRQREYWKNNPEQYEKHKERVKKNDSKKRAHSRHKISKEDYKSLLDKYRGLCWSCKDREGSCIDHDHRCCSGKFSCGQCVRGILCNQCNTALGLLGDSPSVVEKLLAYSSKAERQTYILLT